MFSRFKWLFFLLFALVWMLPWHVVVTVTLTLHDSTGKPLNGDAAANLQAADGTALGTVRLKDGLPSWSNNLHWWSRTFWPLTLLGGGDAVQRATQATVKTQSDMVFSWTAPAQGDVFIRASVIEDCLLSSCRSFQALTELVALPEAFLVTSFE